MPDSPDREKRPQTLRRFLLAIGALVGILVVSSLWVGGLFAYRNRVPDIVVPSRVMPDENGYDDFLNAFRHLSQLPFTNRLWSSPDGPWQINTSEGRREAVEDARVGLSILREGIRRPCLAARWENSEDAFELRVKLRAGMMHSTLLLQFEATGFEEEGRLGDAASSLLDSVEMGVMSQHGADFFAAVAARTALVKKWQPLSDLLPRLSAEEFAVVARRLERLTRQRVAYSEIVREEGHLAVLRVRYDATNRANASDPAKAMEIVFSPEGFDIVSFSNRWGWVRELFVDKARDVEEYAAFCEAFARQTEGPYPGTPATPRPTLEGREYMPDYLELGWRLHLVDEAALALLQTEVALRRYRLDDGRFPDSTDELVPRYLAELPRDPFAGTEATTLKYRSLDGGARFILYSIGPDLADDDGVAKVRSGALIPGSAATPPQLGDMVAGKLGEWEYP